MNANMSSAIVEKTYKMIKNPKKSEIVVSNVGVSAAHEVTHIRVAGKKFPFTIPLTCTTKCSAVFDRQEIDEQFLQNMQNNSLLIAKWTENGVDYKKKFAIATAIEVRVFDILQTIFSVKRTFTKIQLV
jgi:hypothetical protein